MVSHSAGGGGEGRASGAGEAEVQYCRGWHGSHYCSESTVEAGVAVTIAVRVQYCRLLYTIRYERTIESLSTILDLFEGVVSKTMSIHINATVFD